MFLTNHTQHILPRDNIPAQGSEQLHKTFIETLLKFFVRDELTTSVQCELEEIFNDMNKAHVGAAYTFETSVGRSKQKDRYRRGEILYFKRNDEGSVEKFNGRYREEQMKILEQLELCKTTISNLPVYMQKTASLSAKLRTVWASGDQIQEDLQKLIFPEGIHYDRQKDEFRT